VDDLPQLGTGFVTSTVRRDREIREEEADQVEAVLEELVDECGYLFVEHILSELFSKKASICYEQDEMPHLVLYVHHTMLPLLCKVVL